MTAVVSLREVYGAEHSLPRGQQSVAGPVVNLCATGTDGHVPMPQANNSGGPAGAPVRTLAYTGGNGAYTSGP